MPAFLAHLSMECSVSYFDHSPSKVRLSTIFLLTLASTNINQSAPNLVRMYMTIRSRRSFTMELIGPELSELSALELENLPYLTLLTLASANNDQSVPNLATIYMPIRSWMNSIMGQIEPEHPSYLRLNLEKLLNMTFSLSIIYKY